MAETSPRVAAQLTYRLQDGVLFGLAGGRQIHSLTSRPGGAVMSIAPGRYGLTEPTEHPVFGRIAFACPSDPSCGQRKGVENPTRPGGTKAWNLQPGGTKAWNLQPGGTKAWNLQPGGTNAWNLQPGFAAVATMRPGGTNSFAYRPGGSNAFAYRPGGTSSAGGFVLATSALGGNSLIVINGFDELMEALAISGGGSFDVVA
jgi:hypothetical protein